MVFGRKVKLADRKQAYLFSFYIKGYGDQPLDAIAPKAQDLHFCRPTNLIFSGLWLKIK
jgi:hypothetical protein